MNLLPSCAHYIRRVLRKANHSQLPDLLQSVQECNYGLEGRLHDLYADQYEKVILHLEQFVYSHQQAQSRRDEAALQDIADRILWWLGYGIHVHPSNPKIFIVDDAIETLKLVTTLLSKSGYDTDVALSGRLALAKIAAAKPNLILLDINLPDIDGYQVYQALKSSPKTADIPVVFLSGVDTVKTVPAQDKTRVGYLSKPFKPHSLLNCVYRHLEVSSPSYKLADDVLVNELEARHRYAEQLTYVPQEDCGQTCTKSDNDTEESEESACFFRATLDGRYLRVSEAFARLCGYDSSEDIISTVTDIWTQVYEDVDHQMQWLACLQSPNQLKSLSAKVKTKQNQTLDVIEKVSLVQDDYSRNLFYHGYVRA